MVGSPWAGGALLCGLDMLGGSSLPNASDRARCPPLLPMDAGIWKRRRRLVRIVLLCRPPLFPFFSVFALYVTRALSLPPPPRGNGFCPGFFFREGTGSIPTPNGFRVKCHPQRETSHPCAPFGRDWSASFSDASQGKPLAYRTGFAHKALVDRARCRACSSFEKAACVVHCKARIATHTHERLARSRHERYTRAGAANDARCD